MTKIHMRRVAGLFVAILLTTLPLVAVAQAHTFELEKRIVRGEEGDRVHLATFSSPKGLIGLSCSVTASGNNNRSVHPGNDIEVTSNNTVVLIGVEDSANKVTTAAGLLEVGDEVSFTLVLGPDGVYSAELDVTLECQAETTTTTTTSSTTSTTEATTTTTEATTTTTEQSTTTTLAATSTTAPQSTSTTVQVSSTTIAQTSTTGETTDTLPFTGLDSGDLAIVAYVALVAGTGLVLLTRNSSESR